MASVSLGVPLRNQLAATLPNQREMCVPEALSSAISFLTGRHVTGSDLQTQCNPPYGPTYMGGQDAANYVPLVARVYGLRLVAAPLSLATVQASLRLGHPVLLTIPSDWLDNPPRASTTHVVCASGDTGTALTAMNPWGGVWLTEPYAWWATRIRGVLWIVEGSRVANTTGLGPGFANIAETEGADTAIPETYIGHESYATLSNGAVLYYNQQTNECTADKAAVVVALLHDECARLAALVTSLQAAQQTAQQPAMGPGEVEAYAAVLALVKATKAIGQ